MCFVFVLGTKNSSGHVQTNLFFEKVPNFLEKFPTFCVDVIPSPLSSYSVATLFPLPQKSFAQNFRTKKPRVNWPLNASLLLLLLAVWGQFHQHFMSTFAPTFLRQNSRTEKLCSKLSYVKCWWNLHLKGVPVTISERNRYPRVLWYCDLLILFFYWCATFKARTIDVRVARMCYAESAPFSFEQIGLFSRT